MQLVDQIVTTKSIRVVAAQTTPSATVASPKASTSGIQESRL
jgi:type VI secretion system protein ImpL